MAIHKCPLCAGRFTAEVHFDCESGVLRWASGFVVVTGQQRMILGALFTAANQFATYECLAIALWGYDEGPIDQQGGVKQTIWRLRQTLIKADAPIEIKTRHSVGVSLEVATSTSCSSQSPQIASLPLASELLD